MTTSTWHAAPDLLARYAGGRLDDTAQAAVEAHLTACAPCREHARSLAPPTLLDRAWLGIRSEVAAPTGPAVLRRLVRLGLPERDAVILRASSSLHTSAALAVGAAIVCAIVGGTIGANRQDAAFLLLAPLVPVLAVVAAYDATDPLRHLTGTTPASALRTALLRSVAALTIAVPLTIAVGLLVPGLRDLAGTWVLPGLALTSGSLVLLTRWTARVTFPVVAAGWLVLVGLRSGSTVAALTSTGGQVACLVATALLTAVLVLRTSSARPEGQS